ncbi:DUF6082 family protein [Streptomyces atriruber]|uniref:DUF6082 family protein n=1 Tax=Streptomyces atriruber TaxID=545121 RepID=UPI0006E243E6|nr:DUF6082 family protein [Streptomyces atriruber]
MDEPKRQLTPWQWTVAIVCTSILCSAFIWAVIEVPWIIEGDRVKDSDGELVPAAGIIITGLRTAMVGIAAAGLWYTHRTLQHTKESQATDRYIELVHASNIQLLEKALDDEKARDVLNTFDRDVSPAKSQQFVYAEMRYRSLLLALRLGIMSRKEFFGQMRVYLHNGVFREYWQATRHQRMSLPADSLEGEAHTIVDSLALLMDRPDDDLDAWWVIGEEPES